MLRAKAVHIITKMELGGAQENTLFTVNHLNPALFESYLITGPGGELSGEASAFKNFFTAPDLIREVRPWRDLKAFFQIRTFLKKIKSRSPASLPVIVHTHSSKAGILGRWAARSCGMSLIVHSIHGFGFNDYQHALVRGFYILLEKLTARITIKFIAVSRANMDKGVSLGIFSPGKALLIRSGIDLMRFQHPQNPRQVIRQELGIPEDAPLVVMVACFKPQKAPVDFIRACARVRQEAPETHFLLVGDGALRTDVEKEIKTLNLSGCVHLAGWRRDISDILHAADIAALSSLWEGLPRVIPQAMCAGLPVVATNVDGSPEAVEEGVNGFLAAPGDSKKLAELLIDCIRNPEKSREMGMRGKALAAEFDIYKMVQDQEELYKNLIP